MRALTVRQPWAWAIIYSGKDVENRSRTIAGDYRGPVAIHAGLTDDTTPLASWATWAWRDWWAESGTPGGQRGHIIGVVDLVDVHHHTSCPTNHPDALWPLCSRWAHHEGYHLVLANPRPLVAPIPAKGRLGLWTPTPELVEQIEETMLTALRDCSEVVEP